MAPVALAVKMATYSSGGEQAFEEGTLNYLNIPADGFDMLQADPGGGYVDNVQHVHRADRAASGESRGLCREVAQGRDRGAPHRRVDEGVSKVQLGARLRDAAAVDVRAPPRLGTHRVVLAA